MWFNILGNKKYHQLNKVLVSKKALLQNHANLQKIHPEAKICPVLKSNAYGHGIQCVAHVFDSMNCPFLVVDSLYEAYELYKQKVKTKILIMGYTNPKNFMVKKLPFDIAIFDIETAKVLNKYQPGCHVHIFVDTGMNREGINIEKLQTFIRDLKKLKRIRIEGLCSHFADADNPKNLEFSTYQLNQFKKALSILKLNDIDPTWKHLSASGGAFKFFDGTCNMIRAGVAHYGISPLEQIDTYNNNIELKPALEFVSTLIQVKKVLSGDVVGYNCTYTVKKDSVLGVIPVGYYDGVDRGLSNVGYVKIRKQFYPIVGKVSMNITVVDITKLRSPKVGEKVTIYSSNKHDVNSIEQSAMLVGTIPYVLLIHLAESVRRELF